MLDDDLIRRYAALSTPEVSDALGNAGNRATTMDCGIKPVVPGARVTGPAFTVKTYPGATHGSDLALIYDRSLRSTVHPWDEDEDGEADEDPGDDLDGDGWITNMRIPDPEGVWYAHPQDDRVMVRAGGGRPLHRQLPRPRQRAGRRAPGRVPLDLRGRLTRGRGRRGPPRVPRAG